MVHSSWARCTGPPSFAALLNNRDFNSAPPSGRAWRLGRHPSFTAAQRQFPTAALLSLLPLQQPPKLRPFNCTVAPTASMRRGFLLPAVYPPDLAAPSPL